MMMRKPNIEHLPLHLLTAQGRALILETGNIKCGTRTQVVVVVWFRFCLAHHWYDQFSFGVLMVDLGTDDEETNF